MNIGIDFNTKSSRGAFLGSEPNIDNCRIFEVKNALFFANDDVYAGDDGYNKFLTGKNGTFYDLDQIIESNGLVINKTQISVEKCLSVIFSSLLSKIENQAPNNKVDLLSVSIPYDDYYYWDRLIKKAFSLIGIDKIRIVSQPGAFFCQTNITHLYGMLTSIKTERCYLFVSISHSSTDVSLVDYGSGVLEVHDTQHTNSVTRKIIEDSILNYFISEIRKDPRYFDLKDKKNIMRILETVNELLRTPQIKNIFELNLPYVICDDGKYRTLDTKIHLDALNNFLKPIFKNLVVTIKQLAQKIEEAQKRYTAQWHKTPNIIIVICDEFIQQNIKEILPKYFDNLKVVFENERSLATGALNFSRVMTGEMKDYVALEVVPFSVFIRLSGDELVELIKKDSTIPTSSENYSFNIPEGRKSRFVEVQLMMKDGSLLKNLNKWKIKTDYRETFILQVDTGTDLNISVRAFSKSHGELQVQEVST